MADRVVAWQVVSRDPDAMSAFFGGLFGWRVTADNGLGYREVAVDGGVGGGIWPAPPEAADVVQLFVGVDDVDAALDRAAALGATVIVPRQDLPDGDRMAVIAAPGGSTWGLVQRR